MSASDLAEALASSVDLVDDTAISHNTPRKRKDPPADELTPPKRKCTGELLQPEDMSSELLQCIFVAGKCIPLWPQYVHSYVHSMAGKFIRVDRKEEWLIELVLLLRQALIRSNAESCTSINSVNQRPCARFITNDFCDESLQHFRTALAEFRRQQPAWKKRATDAGPHPGLLTIKIHNCEVIASVDARHFYLLTNDQAVTWIKTGLAQMLTKYIELRMRAIHDRQPIADTTKYKHILLKDGIRDKVIWMPTDHEWILRYNGEAGAHEKYCTETNITFQVQEDLEDGEYRIAHQKAFVNACIAWNAIDNSNRKRIRLSPHQLDVKIVPMLDNTDMFHAESGCGSDEESVSYDKD